MRSYQEITRAISVRWIIRKTLRAVIYCVNPLNFFKVLLRLIKWFLYFVFGAVAIGMLTLAVGNYAVAAEWVPAELSVVVNPSNVGACKFFDASGAAKGSFTVTPQGCIDKALIFSSQYWSFYSWVDTPNVSSMGINSSFGFKTKQLYNGSTSYPPDVWRVTYTQSSGIQKYTCPPNGKPEFTFGPKVTENGTVCEKKPVQCLLGSVKDTNTITGKEFCRPICQGIAGNTYGEPLTPVKYFQSNFGSVQIQCYGQCSIRPVGGSVSVDPNLKIWAAVIQFTGENCPIQTQGTEEETSTAGANTPVTPPNSSASTDAAQNQLQNAASSAVSNPTSGATGTATLNTVVDKLAETSNKEIKANSEQNAALGNVIQQTARDIQTSIKEAQMSASQGGAGAGMGQIQTANAIKDGNAQMGTKLDAIKDAIEDSKDDNQGPLPPGDSTIKTNPADVNPHPNDWASRNYNTVMQQHVAAMNALPLFSGISGFFRVEMGAGTCPSFSIDVPQIAGVGGGSIVFDVFCNADLQRIFEIIALCVKLLGLYVAFRIALLD